MEGAKIKFLIKFCFKKEEDRAAIAKMTNVSGEAQE